MATIVRLLTSRLSLRLLATIASFLLFGIGIAYAALPGGKTMPVGTAVPNPGTQAQELGNITFPAPFNVFEFPVTCGACHGGTVDQQVGHYGNWAGSNMASSARDPIFRANAMIINETVRSLTGQDGGANICFRCHSPNGWLSGRFDPAMAGQGNGSTMIHSILASTDDEGISCETCHRAIGSVEMQEIGGLKPAGSATQADVDALQTLVGADPAFNMMAGFKDWPHAGLPYPNGPQKGDPLGDATLQYNDGMAYGGKYAGSVQVYYSDVPLKDSENRVMYTGQTYGIYPTGYTGIKNPVPSGMPQFNSVGQEIVYNPDGSVPIHFEVPIAPPSNPDGTPNFSQQAISLEHPTFKGDFIRSAEFCGSCHDLTIPVLNHGMPEQRTYTEWKYSSYGASNQTCQSCHAGSLKHEYADNAPVTLNADPTLVGWAPYGKDRNPNGGTTVHKLAGANRDLPAMMKILYPEVDLEIIGAPTGRDTRVFPGLMSSRDNSYDRTIRNTELQLRNALNVEIVKAPTYNATTGKWELQVKVTNTSGHRIPTGYPDGRRFWLSLNITDGSGATVYQSGVYDQNSATLKTDAGSTGFTRALGNTIDSGSNAVMVYEKVTATCKKDAAGAYTSCAPSVSLLNDVVIFDNRIPPAGYNKAEYFESGTRFYTYDPATFVPTLDSERFGDGQNYDIVTYTFDAPANAVLNARAEVYWQTHSREHMEHLRTSDNSNVRPEGPPSIYEPNYPLTPTYLSDVVVAYVNGQTTLPEIASFGQLKALDGAALRDNWGGVAYAAWLLTGKGEPFQVDAASTTQSAAPAAPGVAAAPFDPFAIDVSWNQVPNADGYVIWTRYGLSDATASWDTLKVYYPTAAERASNARLSFRNDGLNVGKTYAYKVEAFNGKGSSMSGVVSATTPGDLPLAPEQLTFVSATANTITLSWFDMADNETGFIIERQDVPPTADFVEVARIDSPKAGGATGGVQWTDTNGLVGGKTYNYQVRAFNPIGVSLPSLPIQAKTGGAPTGPIVLASAFMPGPQVSLFWSAAGGTVDGYRIERAPVTNGVVGAFAQLQGSPVAGGVTSFADSSVAPQTTYAYRVTAFNGAGAVSSNLLQLTTPPAPPATPSNFRVITPVNIPVELRWSYNWPNNAPPTAGFIVERAVDTNGVGDPVFAVIARPNRGARSYSDATAQPKTTYLYRVSAYVTRNNVTATSLASTAVSVVTPGEIPQAPSGLTVGNPSRTTLTLRWRDNSVNEENFLIFRAVVTNGTVGQFNQVGTANSNFTSYRDQNLNPNTTYAYYVVARNRNGSSAPSETVQGTTRR